MVACFLRPLLIFLLLLAVAVGEVNADSNPNGSATFRARGLSFLCPSCRAEDDDACIVGPEPDLGVTVVKRVRCDDLPALVLPTLQHYNGHAPEPIELKNFLFSGHVKSGTAKAALRLMMETAEGSELIRENAASLFDSYGAELRVLLLEGKGDVLLWKSFWELRQIDDLTLDDELRAAVAARFPEIGLDRIFANLTGKDFDADLLQLNTYRGAMAQLKPDWAEVLSKTAKVIQRCREPFTPPQLAEECTLQWFQMLPPAATKYLATAQMRLVLKQLAAGSPDAVATLETLTQTDYKSVRLRELNEIIARTLYEIVESRLMAVRTRALQTANIDLLIRSATENPLVANLLAKAFNRAAMEGWTRGQVEETMTFLERSFQVSKGSIPERSVFLQSLSGQSAIINNPTLAGRLSELKVQALVSSIQRHPNPLAWIIFTLLVLYLFLMGAVALHFRRGRAEAAAARAAKENEISSEFEQLCQYFGLENSCSERELTRQYRRKVKQLHPDMGTNSSQDEFSLLVERYRRAKLLLSQKDETAAPTQ